MNLAFDILFIVLGIVYVIKPTMFYNSFSGIQDIVPSKTYKIYRRIFGVVLIVVGLYSIIARR